MSEYEDEPVPCPECVKLTRCLREMHDDYGMQLRTLDEDRQRLRAALEAWRHWRQVCPGRLVSWAKKTDEAWTTACKLMDEALDSTGGRHG